jgi:hypothetical protein
MRDGISYWEAEWPKPSTESTTAGTTAGSNPDRYGSVF